MLRRALVIILVAAVAVSLYLWYDARAQACHDKARTSDIDLGPDGRCSTYDRYR